jgi:hypothetical protein
VGNSNLPDSSVQLTQLLLVSILVTRTVAEGTATPSVVFTVPEVTEALAGAAAEPCGGGCVEACLCAVARDCPAKLAIEIAKSQAKSHPDF